MDVMRRKCFLLFVPALLWSVSTGARIAVNDSDLKLQSLIIPHIVLSILCINPFCRLFVFYCRLSVCFFLTHSVMPAKELTKIISI